MKDFRKTMAVLMTCHNRRKKTMACLDSLSYQNNVPNLEITVYLVDDGSTDGTVKAVKENYPKVNILKGDGSLYWTGGMYKAMEVAMQKGFDSYLWLNDDAIMYPNAFDNLLSVYRDKNYDNKYPKGIIVGSLCDPDTGEWTYGAAVKSSNWHPLRFSSIVPESEAKEADKFWGNVVLIPSEIVDDIGNLDNRFTHRGADHDYAFRAKDAGYKIWVTPGFIGETPRNSKDNTWKDRDLSFIQRFRKLISIKGEPIKQRFYFMQKHGGWLFPIFFLSPYVKLIVDHFFNLKD